MEDEVDKKVEAAAPAEEPKPARVVYALTDGNVIQFRQMTCTAIELQAIGQKCIQVAQAMSEKCVRDMQAPKDAPAAPAEEPTPTTDT